MVQLCLSPDRRKMAQWKQDILKINGIPSNFNLSDFNYYMLHLNKRPESAIQSVWNVLWFYFLFSQWKSCIHLLVDYIRSEVHSQIIIIDLQREYI